MKSGSKEIRVVASLLVSAVLAVAPAAAQVITGVLGSPSATTTLQGNQVPPPPPKFGGVIKESARDSTTWWVLATEKVEHTIPFLIPADETFDVGADTRTPVDSSYAIPFRFTGKIDRLTFKLGPSQLAEADEKKVQEAIARARD